MVMTPSQKSMSDCTLTREAVRNQDREREAGLARLLALLESEADPATAHNGPVHNDSLSHIARLRNAHASYALATTGEMEREGPGAWVRRNGRCARHIQ